MITQINLRNMEVSVDFEIQTRSRYSWNHVGALNDDDVVIRGVKTLDGVSITLTSKEYWDVVTLIKRGQPSHSTSEKRP